MRLALLVLLLAGCATGNGLVTEAPKAPTVVVEHCTKPEQIPVLPPSNAIKTGTHRQNAAAMAADAEQARQVAGDAIALLQQCSAN